MPIINTDNIFKDPPGLAWRIFYLKPLLTVAALLAGFISFSQPRLEIAETKKNFGFVQRGTVVRNVYALSNTGSQPLIFTGSEVSCSCTSVNLPGHPVLPGAKDSIVVVFDTKTVYGRQDRVVYISSNDPKGEVKLRYKGSVSNK